MKIQDFNPKALRLAIGADHGGFELKEQLVASLQASGITVMDKGPAVLDPADDYPVTGSAVARAVSCGDADCGILVCRSGAGMGIVANRFHGVRPTCWCFPATKCPQKMPKPWRMPGSIRRFPAMNAMSAV